jgi:hypothetical protein
MAVKLQPMVVSNKRMAAGFLTLSILFCGIALCKAASCRQATPPQTETAGRYGDDQHHYRSSLSDRFGSEAEVQTLRSLAAAPDPKPAAQIARMASAPQAEIGQQRAFRQLLIHLKRNPHTAGSSSHAMISMVPPGSDTMFLSAQSGVSHNDLSLTPRTLAPYSG